MISREFYGHLSSLKGFKWSIDEDNTIIGVKAGQTYNPVTALAAKQHVGIYSPTTTDTMKAGVALGLPRAFVKHAINASNSNSNRGNAQVVRGKIRSALGV